MHRATGAWQLLGLLSLALSVLIGCHSNTERQSTAQSTSRLMLQLTSTTQTRRLPPRTVLPAQSAAVASLQITITGDGIDDPIGVACTLLVPSTDARCQPTADGTMLAVTLVVPQGNDRRIVVTAFDTEGVATFLGKQTVTLSQATATVTITLLRLAAPADVENQTFTFADGAAFGLSGQEITLAFGGFAGSRTAPVTLHVPVTAGSATGTATVASIDLVFAQSTIPDIPSGPPGLSFTATVNGDGSLNLTNTATDVTSSSASQGTIVAGRVTDPNGNGIAGAAVLTNAGLTGLTTTDGTFSIANVPTILGDIAASAAGTVPEGTLTGSSPRTPPVPGGVTDVGTIAVFLVKEDTVILTSDPFQIPSGSNSLAFTFNFLSNAFPNVVGPGFDDIAFALLRPEGTTGETQVLASVNTSTFSPADGTGFTGQTGYSTATFDVSSLAGSAIPVILVLSVRDVGDSAIDTAILIDDIRLVDATGSEQPIPQGDFESGDLTHFTVSFTHVNGPMVGTITGLGDVDNLPRDNFPGPEDIDHNGDGLLTTGIVPPDGRFMALLSTGTTALAFITRPPSFIGTRHPRLTVVNNGDGTVTIAGATDAVPPDSVVQVINATRGILGAVPPAADNGSFISNPIAAAPGDTLIIDINGGPTSFVVTVGDTFPFVLDVSRLDDPSQRPR